MRISPVVLLAATELWERFTYYGMRALLVLFFVAPYSSGGFGLANAHAAAIYGLFAASVYLSALPGGWLADRYLGPVPAIWLGGALICCGNLILAFAQGLAQFAVGLVLIALGIGLLKPNVTALVARASAAESMPIDSAFTLFYVGINIGAVAGPLVSSVLVAATGWRGGFAAAAAGMLMGLIAFSRVAARFTDANPPPLRSTRWLLPAILAALALLGFICWQVPATVLLRSAVLLVVLTAVGGFTVLLRASRSVHERRRVWLMIALFCGASLFWAAGEQAAVSLTLFAERFTDRSVFGWHFPSASYQSLYPLYIVLFAPFFVWGWQRMAAVNREPSNVLKFGVGLLIAAGGLGVATLAALRAGDGLIGPQWLAIAYLLLALGEILVSPVGLAAGTRLTPAGHTGFSTGLWYLSLSLGGLLAGLTGGLFEIGQARGLAAAFGSVGLSIAIAGIGFVIAAWVMAATIRELLGVDPAQGENR